MANDPNLDEGTMIPLVNPSTGETLARQGELLVDASSRAFPIVRGVARICASENYAQNFGKQWNMFRSTQIDRHDTGQIQSELRFFKTTCWTSQQLDSKDVLEVGSGAGRFS